MNRKLFWEAMIKFSLGVVLVGALVFLPAGTWHYPGGWLFLGILFVPMFGAGLVMMAKNPMLLRSRLDAKEKQKEQDTVVKLSGLMFLAGFIVAGLNFRFGWWVLPWGVSLAGAAAFPWLGRRRFSSPICFMRKFCGKTPGCPEPLKFRKIKRWWTPAFTASSGIPCTA